MFTNATVLELYARARHDEDLRALVHRHPTGWQSSLRGLLRRLAPQPRPAPVPVPIPARPPEGTH